jgi:hypothetical protein
MSGMILSSRNSDASLPQTHLPLRIRRQRRTRRIARAQAHARNPKRAKGRTLVATWNIANFGLQQRRAQDRHLIAEILSWFDIVAVQEVRSNSRKAKVLEEIGEIGVPPKDLPNVKLPGVTETFEGFDRNPYVATFQVGETTLLFQDLAPSPDRPELAPPKQPYGVPAVIT